MLFVFKLFFKESTKIENQKPWKNGIRKWESQLMEIKIKNILESLISGEIMISCVVSWQRLVLLFKLLAMKLIGIQVMIVWIHNYTKMQCWNQGIQKLGRILLEWLQQYLRWLQSFTCLCVDTWSTNGLTNLCQKIISRASCINTTNK